MKDLKRLVLEGYDKIAGGVFLRKGIYEKCIRNDIEICGVKKESAEREFL